jgi:ADP-ribosylglycohydrolase
MTLPHDYVERIYAGVLGKLIGVYLGRPFEGWKYDRIMRELGEVSYYVHERLGVPLVVTDDDIGGTFTFVRALEDNGYDPRLDAARIGDTWLNYIVENRAILWWGGIGNSTEHTAYLRLKHGMKAPESGAIATNGAPIAEQIGAEIFIDGWAMVSPGNPAQAARLAREAARVSHDGEAVHAAVLLAVMEAQAFVEKDVDRLLDTGLATIPAGSLVARLIGDVRRWHAEHPDWHTTRDLIDQHYGYHLYPGNCHVIPNHAVIILALLYGQHDFQTAMRVANTAGWDTDCNAGNVGCLMGLRLGLAGLEAGPDWRGPIADRLYLSTADGGTTVTDAVRVTYDLARTATALAGMATPPAPKDGARFHFALPGSVQGFGAELSPETLREVMVENAELDGTRALAIRFRHLAPGQPAFVRTPVFTPPEVEKMRTYEMLASPALNPGQCVRARLIGGSGNTRPLTAALAVRVYGSGDKLVRVAGPEATLAPGTAIELDWTIPDLGGRPIAEIGLLLSAEAGQVSGTVFLDRLDWSGEPTLQLARPSEPSTFWRRAWVNAVTGYSGHFPQAFRISQDEGRGLLIYGTREWRNYRVSAQLTVHLGTGGIAARVQGLRRYLTLLLQPGGGVHLIEAYDDAQTVLAEAPCDWILETPITLALVADGNRIAGLVEGQKVLEATLAPHRLTGGAVALVADAGCISTDIVVVEGDNRS